MSEPMVWRGDLGAYAYGTEGGCEFSRDRWCKTHSTSEGPVYCQPEPTTTPATDPTQGASDE